MVVICKKAALFRDALAAVVTSRGHQVVSCVGDLAEAVPAIEKWHPDVMLLDASLLNGDAMERLGAHREGGRAPRLVLLTGSKEDSAVTDAVLDMGADRVLDDAAALRTLERAVAGRPTQSARPSSPKASAARHPSSALTARERDVIDLLAVGLSTQAIATTLKVSRSTVHSHVQSILRKLGARSRLQAVSIYLGETTSDLGSATGS